MVPYDTYFTRKWYFATLPQYREIKAEAYFPIVALSLMICYSTKGIGQISCQIRFSRKSHQLQGKSRFRQCGVVFKWQLPNSLYLIFLQNTTQLCYLSVQFYSNFELPIVCTTSFCAIMNFALLMEILRFRGILTFWWEMNIDQGYFTVPK